MDPLRNLSLVQLEQLKVDLLAAARLRNLIATCHQIKANDIPRLQIELERTRHVVWAPCRQHSADINRDIITRCHKLEEQIKNRTQEVDSRIIACSNELSVLARKWPSSMAMSIGDLVDHINFVKRFEYAHICVEFLAGHNQLSWVNYHELDNYSHQKALALRCHQLHHTAICIKGDDMPPPGFNLTWKECPPHEKTLRPREKKEAEPESAEPAEPTPLELVEPAEPTPLELVEPAEPTPLELVEPAEPTPLELVEPIEPTPLELVEPIEPKPAEP
jgi:hypothetical protein